MQDSFVASGYHIEIVNGYVGSPGETDIITIDQLADSHFVPEFIKIDIEGHELQALEGAQKILSLHGPALVVEVHSEALEDACCVLLRSFGYSPMVVKQDSYFGKEFRGMSYNAWLVCERSGMHE